MPIPQGPDPVTQGVLTSAPATAADLTTYTQPPGGAPDFTRVISSLRRFRWTILGLTLLGLGGGIAGTRVIKPNYSVQATIWIETPNKGKSGPIQGEELLESKAWVELLTTFKVLDPVVQRRKLYLDYAEKSDSTLFRAFDLTTRFLPGQFELSISKDGKSYRLVQRNGVYTEAGSLADSVGRQVGFRWAPRPTRAQWGRTVKFDIVTPREASGQLIKSLTTKLKEGNFLVLQLQDDNPEAAAATLNTLIQRYVDEAADQKRRKLTLLAAVLDTQVIDQAERLKSAEEALESFRVGTVTLPREDAPVAAGLQFTQPTVYSEYFKQRTVLDSLRRDQRDIEEVLKRNRAGEIAVDAFNTIGAIRQAPDLQKVLGELSTAEADLRTMLTKYTEEYDGVRRLRDRIQLLRTQTIPLYAEALVRQLQDRQNELSSRVSLSSRELQSIPVRSQNESRLKRAVDQADILYRSLEASRQQARLAEA
ncbi:MAG TPA: Wzz/FepE/Etk N-terminal domain-containing protein, partial [Gemmatimonadales bacterium]